MTTRVLVMEEYGYRYWEWEFPGDADAVVAWWKGLPSVQPMFFDPSKILEIIGPIRQLNDLEDDMADEYQVVIHVHDNSDSWCRDNRHPPVQHSHAGAVGEDDYNGSRSEEAMEYIRGFAK